MASRRVRARECGGDARRWGETQRVPRSSSARGERFLAHAGDLRGGGPSEPTMGPRGASPFRTSARSEVEARPRVRYARRSRTRALALRTLALSLGAFRVLARAASRTAPNRLSLPGSHAGHGKFPRTHHRQHDGFGRARRCATVPTRIPTGRGRARRRRSLANRASRRVAARSPFANRAER